MACTLVVHEDSEEEFRVDGFKSNTSYTVLFYIIGFLSVGLIFLLGYWYPVRRMKFTHSKCALEEATTLLIKQTHGGQLYLSKMKTVNYSKEHKELKDKQFSNFELELLSRSCFKYFEHKFLRYYFNSKYDRAFEISGLDEILTVKEIYEISQGLSRGSCLQKLILHGENFINVPVRSYFIVFIQLVADPFYVFQVFSVSLWYSDNYIYYASVIVLMTLFSLILNTYETKSHLQKLHDMVADAFNVKILSRGENGVDVTSKSSKDLVPGDVLVIPPEGLHLPCDAVLLNGRCVVNESTLTGESFPTTKTGIDGMTSASGSVLTEIFSVNMHKRHTLYNGTEILQAHFYGEDTRILAVVIRTGFCTLKGRLIRSIIHPKPVHFTFFRDSMKFILFLGFLAFFGFVYTIIIFIRHGEPPGVIARKSLDVFTIAVPPALPACMSIGLMYALHRLRKKRIYCIDPARVNVCGKVKMFVFDKTGTLTEDTLAVSGVVRLEDNVAQPMEHSVNTIRDSSLVKAMACCHSLTIFKGQLIGDPLDSYMFDFTKWKINEPSDESGSKYQLLAPVTVSPPKIISATDASQETVFDGDIENAKEIGILKQYPFESSLQRMSVITKQLGHSNMTVYAKGSPEMILSFCQEESKPVGILDILMEFTKAGSRVLAVATKNLPSSTKWHHLKKLSRSEVESELQFLGLIIFENVLKPASKNVIKTLENANIRTIMATGDNLYTAASVAREVDIVKSYQKIIEVKFGEEDKLTYDVLQREDSEVSKTLDAVVNVEYNNLDYTVALNGSTFMRLREKYAGLLPKILMSASIFARMSPDQKTILVEDLKKIGYGVGMCGDGANDCGALKAAHAGIALSNTEASVASPFTSKVFDISCVPLLLKEGRAALVTSFGIFKYMALYSFLQFIGVLILYSSNSNYSDFQFLYVDLFLNLPLVVTMIQSEASDKMTKKRPPGKLVHPIFLGGILLQTLILFIFQFGAFIYVRHIYWYKPPSSFKENEKEELNFVSYENVAVLTVSYFQYIWLSAVCASGKPYRKPLYLNYKYVLMFICATIFTTYISLDPPEAIRKLFLIASVPSWKFLLSLVLISFGHFYVSYVVEKIFLPSAMVKRLSDYVRGKKEPRNEYKHIYNTLKNNSDWPPLKRLSCDESEP
ncbi:polyamine-transporting ATPase 13A3-like [Hydractinia symbiolongicarpus]|uniref:polyamine-transporting ATPase 13A3-like n=1 Tax=Hydractinia symbiolongicarpus TaxID=13093 RepID=UPI002551904D|nr:polyamine-transporting ATPase 13A3-like [Hydractinia symbiolongicarpus]